MSEAILAAVNGKKITQSTVDNVLANMDPRRSGQFKNPQGQKYLLEEIIRQELLLADAEERNLMEEEEFIESLNRVREDLAKQYAIRKLLSGVTVEDSEISSYYEENKSLFAEPESVKASHILVDSEEEANKIHNEIKSGLSFEEAAGQYSSCPSKEVGGDLGFFTQGKMVPEFEVAAFAMEIGDICNPVKTQFGYHLILVTDKKAAQSRSLEEVKDVVSQQLLAEKQNQIYLNKTEALKAKYPVMMMEK